MDDLRLEVRLRNQRLWAFIHEESGYPTVAAFCRAHGLAQAGVGALLNRTESPSTERSLKAGARAPTALASRLCELSGYSFEELFPGDLYGDLIPRRVVATTHAERFVSLAAAKHLPMLGDGTEEQVVAEERRLAVETALATLPAKQQAVIRARFGLADGDEATLREAGKLVGVGPERVRQIEAKALRKLRHPSRSRPLRTFLESRPVIDVPKKEEE